MLDFLKIEVKQNQKQLSKFTVSPVFVIKPVKDIMVRGKSFYAVWDEENNIWSTDIFRAVDLIDHELYLKKEELKKQSQYYQVSAEYLSDSNTGSMYQFRRYMEKLMGDNFIMLNNNVIFADHEIVREDYATFKLPYSVREGDTSSWDELVGTLYSTEERMKIEWAIGAVATGDSKFIQKFIIFYGDAGTGKSTIMNIIAKLFEGYVGSIDAKALGNGNASFSLETLKDNPLVAIQDDANLSRIDDNTKFNSLVSHERIIMNEKFKSQYSVKFDTFIFLGSNQEVKITDVRSGLLRRIIDITPTGHKFSYSDYMRLMRQVEFEYGAIVHKCINLYLKNKDYYNKYYPIRMIRATNTLYNFVEDTWSEMLGDKTDISLKDAWRYYKEYCEMADVPYPLSMQAFKNEFKNYFNDFLVDGHDIEGNHLRNYFMNFKFEKIGIITDTDVPRIETWLKFEEAPVSLFDISMEDQPAQVAPNGIPAYKWSNCKTTLKDINTRGLHYVKVPENHIVIDLDLKDESGEKSFEKNLEAATVWPKTYAEVSKSGAAIHLHYIYDGDVSKLKRLYSDGIEVKVFTGDASLRRKLTTCVNNEIATISEGVLPLKEKGAQMVSDFVVSNEKAIRTMILKNLRKEYHPGTKPSIDYIFKILEDAYNANIMYDVTDLRPAVLTFANNSSNHAEYCVSKVADMHFMQDVDNVPDIDADIHSCSADLPIAFFDVEVFPNLFVLVYKLLGAEKACTSLINPTAKDVEDFCTNFRLIGFNNRRYDNHILYARIMDYSNEQLYELSQRIISGSKNATFLEAYKLSYTDVYDFSSAVNKKGLKKWEIELGIHHLELGLPWDKPVDERLWEKVAEYCCNDVISTEVVFNHLKSDWAARLILADLSGLTPNDSTNTHTTRIIFGNNKHPQNEFLYRDLSKPVTYLEPEVSVFLWERFPEMMKWWSENTDSLLPYFPGYTYDRGKSVYKGITVGEGGYVEAIPGMYGYTGLLDVASMHPHSMLSECLFGAYYTKKVSDIVDARLNIKHKDYDLLNDILDGKFIPYVNDLKNGEISNKDLSNALKTVINSMYGLTDAGFENPFRDIRNKDNIVAKRGALFMVDLAEEVKKRGYTVAHIKTDSIKIPDITQEIADFIFEFGKRYGYTFEWEATYDKMCLVNNAVYIARYRNDDGGVGEWTATGAQFAEPYVFKTLFSHEDLTFDDYCQTKSVTTALYLDMNENLGDDEHNYIFIGGTGSFVPVVEGAGGGILVREKDGKYLSAAGAKGYRWLEAETVKTLHKEDDIDVTYFAKMADEAVAALEEFGYFSWLVDPAPYNCTVPFGTEPEDDFMNLPETTKEEDEDDQRSEKI